MSAEEQEKNLISRQQIKIHKLNIIKAKRYINQSFILFSFHSLL